MEKIKYDPILHVENARPMCPVCSSQADVYKRKLDPKDVYEGWCETCGGNLKITEAAVLEARKERCLHLIAAWLRRHPNEDSVQTLRRDDVTQIVRDSPKFSVLEKLNNALIVIAEMTDFPGALSKYRYTTDWPRIYAQNVDEALFYQTQLFELGYIEARTSPKLTAKGFLRLAELEQSGRTSSAVFVAMWFSNSQDEVWTNAIEPAIREAGYHPIRIDKHPHVNRIDDEIIGQIKKARFMVADFTGQRAGVYFEAGLMLGLGRNVIWMCSKEQLREVHFDTRQYNFIDYETVSEAKKRLYDPILAIEEEGPAVVRQGG